MSDTIKESLLASAATIGSAMAADKAKYDADLATVGEAQGKAKRDKELLERLGKGFHTAKWRGVIAMGDALGNSGLNFADDDAVRAVAKDMVRAFNAAFTGKTEKSDKGGNDSGLVNIITLGNGARAVLTGLQGRLAHYYGLLDAAKAEEDKTAAKELMDQANRFLQPPDPAVFDKKTGKVTKPARWNGRPEATVNDIYISPTKGSNRQAQATQAAALYRQHGGKALNEKVLDALLDNGGLAEKTVDFGDVARAAAKLINDLLNEHGASASLDAAALTGTMGILNQIADRGYRMPKPPKPAAVTPPPLPTMTPPAKATEEVVDLLTGVPESKPDEETTDKVTEATTPPPLPTAPRGTRPKATVTTTVSPAPRRGNRAGLAT